MEREDKMSNKARKYTKYSSFGFELAAITIVGYFIGNAIDTRMGTSRPYFTILFIFIFIIASFYRLIKKLESEK